MSRAIALCRALSQLFHQKPRDVAGKREIPSAVRLGLGSDGTQKEAQKPNYGNRPPGMMGGHSPAGSCSMKLEIATALTLERARPT